MSSHVFFDNYTDTVVELFFIVTATPV